MGLITPLLQDMFTLERGSNFKGNMIACRIIEIIHFFGLDLIWYNFC